MTKLVECVPNFSEGRRPEVVAAIRDAIAAEPGATVLDASADASHHRSVVTFVAPPARAADAAFAAVAEAAHRIDLTTHTGEHPRIGAADVVPFVPLQQYGTTMADCVALAHTLGERVGRELGVPVYLYEHAATRPARRLRSRREALRTREAAGSRGVGPGRQRRQPRRAGAATARRLADQAGHGPGGRSRRDDGAPPAASRRGHAACRGEGCRARCDIREDRQNLTRICTN